MNHVTYFEIQTTCQGPADASERNSIAQTRISKFLDVLLYGVNAGDKDARVVHIDPKKVKDTATETSFGVLISKQKITPIGEWKKKSVEHHKEHHFPGWWVPTWTNRTETVTVRFRVKHNADPYFLAEVIERESDNTDFPMSVQVSHIQGPSLAHAGWLYKSYPKSTNKQDLHKAIVNMLPPRYSKLQFDLVAAKISHFPDVVMDQGSAIHVVCDARAVRQCQRAFNEVLYHPRRLDGFPLDRKYVFIPTVEATRNLACVRSHLEDVHARQLQFEAEVETMVVSDLIKFLDDTLTGKFPYTLREFIMGIINPLSSTDRPMFLAIDSYATDSTQHVFTYFKKDSDTAKTVIAQLPLLVIRAAKTQAVFQLFCEGTEEEMKQSFFRAANGDTFPIEVAVFQTITDTFAALHSDDELSLGGATPPNQEEGEDADQAESRFQDRMAQAMPFQPEDVVVRVHGKLISSSREEWDRARTANESLCSLATGSSTVCDISTFSVDPPTPEGATPSPMEEEKVDPHLWESMPFVLKAWQGTETRAAVDSFCADLTTNMLARTEPLTAKEKATVDEFLLEIIYQKGTTHEAQDYLREAGEKGISHLQESLKNLDKTPWLKHSFILGEDNHRDDCLQQWYTAWIQKKRLAPQDPRPKHFDGSVTCLLSRYQAETWPMHRVADEINKLGVAGLRALGQHPNQVSPENKGQDKQPWLTHAFNVRQWDDPSTQNVLAAWRHDFVTKTNRNPMKPLEVAKFDALIKYSLWSMGKTPNTITEIQRMLDQGQSQMDLKLKHFNGQPWTLPRYLDPSTRTTADTYQWYKHWASKIADITAKPNTPDTFVRTTEYFLSLHGDKDNPLKAAHAELEKLMTFSALKKITQHPSPRKSGAANTTK
ncbi:expressed unknown protein [Seminavis robusta]|uniref:Uncharacterized protein n=1 Tax=Seminavis robusta TaxID=568900 RepID=A0A9N8F1I7_9STRA|nr:expressed unknown protein [Seminavis robusta]|eukprot:Sro3292_g346270.1 n/a (883) ;mRNA; f:2613-5261